VLLGGIALVQAIAPIATHLSVAWSVSLSSVRFVQPAWTRSTHLDAWFDRHSCGVQWHIVLDEGFWPPGKERCRGWAKTSNCLFMIPQRAAPISVSAFYRITSVLVVQLVVQHVVSVLFGLISRIPGLLYGFFSVSVFFSCFQLSLFPSVLVFSVLGLSSLP